MRHDNDLAPSDLQAIEDIMRAHMTISFPGAPSYLVCAGPLAAYKQIWARTLRFSYSEPVPPIAPLTIKRAGPDQVVVMVNQLCRSNLGLRTGQNHTFLTTLEEVFLRRTPDGWRVIDEKDDGEQVLAGVFLDVEGGHRDRSAEIRIKAAVHGASGTGLLTSIKNNGGKKVRLYPPILRVPGGRWVIGYSGGAVRVDPGEEEVFQIFTRHPLPLDARNIELKLPLRWRLSLPRIVRLDVALGTPASEQVAGFWER